jgi:hypothetical protein
VNLLVELPMDRNELNRLLRQRPFQPFSITTRDGRTYQVHPRMNLLAEKYIKIGIPNRLRPHLCDHGEYVRLDEIARVELLPSPPPKTL